MVWFGDIYIPWITEKDTSITKDIVEKNFVGENPQVYELTPDLENGTYSFILNENVHEKNESFEEQQDAVLSMVNRHGTEFPFAIGGDEGFALVENASTSIGTTQEIRNADAELRFLSDEDYYSAFEVKIHPYIDGDFEEETDLRTMVAFPDTVDVIETEPEYIIRGEDSNMELYTMTEPSLFEYEDPYNDSRRKNICKLYNSEGERLYSDCRVVDAGSYINNGLVRVGYDDTSSQLEYWDSGSWDLIGEASLNFGDGYPSKNQNDEIDIEFINGNGSTIYRGFSAVKYTFSNTNDFHFSTEAEVDNMSIRDFYSWYWEKNNDHDVILIRTSDDGDFYSEEYGFGIENLDASEEYSVFIAVMTYDLSDIYIREMAEWVYNIGTRRPTFTQK